MHFTVPVADRKPSPVLIGARLVGAGIGGSGPSALVSGGIKSGPLALHGMKRVASFGTLGQDATTTTPDSTATSSTPSWITQLIGAGTQIENVIAQQDLNRINIQRAAQGLPPLPSSVVGPTATVGLAPDVQNLLIYGGIGFAALFLLNAALKR